MIYVKAGNYYERVIVDKAVSLVGERREATTIYGNGTGLHGSVIRVDADSVTISGFTIVNKKEDGFNGVGLYKRADCNIVGNILSGNFMGIVIVNSSSVRMTDNVMENNQYGVAGDDCSNCCISRNTATNNWDGIGIDESSAIEITENNVTNNQDCGIASDFPLDYNNIARNNIANNPCGIWLNFLPNSNLARNSIVANNITGNHYGITLRYSTNMSITNNNVANNGVGIWLEESSSNFMYHNNFVKNLFQINDPANIWDNGYPSGGNYWSNYVGVDVKKGPAQDQPGSDGIGDVPYVINSNNIDRYSLMNPYGFPSPSNYPLTIIVTSGGTTDPASGTYTYNDGTQVPITAIPETDYKLDCWKLDDISVGSANPYETLMNQGHTLKAVFIYSSPPLSGSHELAITDVAVSKAVVGQGFTLPISVTISNHGAYPEDLNVTMYVNTTKIDAFTGEILLNGTSATISFSWNTTGFAKGSYNVSAYACPVQDETDTADNNFTGRWIAVAMVGDLTGGTPILWGFMPDGKCNILDISVVAKCFGSYPGAPPPLIWNANCDMTGPVVRVPDGKVNILDVSLVARHFGEHDP